MTIRTVMGPAGSPMRAPYGSFAGKPNSQARSGVFTVMGPAGSPMRAPYGSFAGKPTASGGTLPHCLPFHATVGQLKSF